MFNKHEIKELNTTSDFISSNFNKVFKNDVTNFNITECENRCKTSQKMLKSIDDNEYNIFSIDTINSIFEKI